MSEEEGARVQGVRTLGSAEHRETPAATAEVLPIPEEVKARARDLLKDEFEKALALIEKRKAESAIGGKEKGRAAARPGDAHRSIVASLEGMNRFALGIGLVTPAESRELFADALKRGLYEGWS